MTLKYVESIHIGTDWTDDYESICNKLVTKHKWSHKRYKSGKYVFDIAPNNIRYFQPLFDRVYHEVKGLYPRADIPEKFASAIWAYVSNKDRSVTFLHNHMKEKIQRDISTVYYLKKPEGSGDIMFLVDGEKVIHTPEEGDLLVFPATMYHAPMPTECDEYRIAININVITNNDYSNFLTR